MVRHCMQAVWWKGFVCRVRLAVGFLAALAAWCLLAGPCWGQAEGTRRWKEMREYTAADGSKVKIPKQPKLKRYRVQEILRSGKVPTADEPAFEEYFMYVIAEFTWESKRSELADLRDQLKRYYLQEAGKDTGGTELHDRLVQLMLSQFMSIALDAGYAPAVRYNAILVVGDLNLREGTPPLREDYAPLPQAAQPLLEVASKAEHPYYLRVGALVGIERHVRSRDGIASELRRGLVRDLTSMLQNAAGDSAGSVWLRRRATRCMAVFALKYPDLVDSGVGSVLGDIVANDKADVAFRCDAAYALGTLQDRAIPAEGVQKILLGMGELAMRLISDASRQTHASVPSADAGSEDAAPSAEAQDEDDASADDGSDAGDAGGKAIDDQESDAQADDADAGNQPASDEKKPADSDDPFASDSAEAPPKQQKKKRTTRTSGSTDDTTTVEVRKVMVRTLSSRLIQLRLGLEGVPAADGTAVGRGLAAAAAAQLKPLAAELAAKVKEIEELVGSSLKMPQEEFIAQLLVKRRELEQWYKSNSTAQPAAAAGAAATPKGGPVAAAK